jgi:hypothetical protein
MRERSEKIAAKFKVSSKIGGGTEVDLRIPARIAFPPRGKRKLTQWISKMYTRSADQADDKVTKMGRH